MHGGSGGFSESTYVTVTLATWLDRFVGCDAFSDLLLVLCWWLDG